jgi:hypothetical protein
MSRCLRTEEEAGRMEWSFGEGMKGREDEEKRM